MADIAQVKSALAADPSLTDLSDADAASRLSVPVKTPRPERAALAPLAKLLADMKVASAVDADKALHVDRYPAGGPVTAEEVAEARTLLDREAAVDAFIGRVVAYLNEHAHSARNDPSIDLPTAKALAEYVEAGK